MLRDAERKDIYPFDLHKNAKGSGRAEFSIEPAGLTVNGNAQQRMTCCAIFQFCLCSWARVPAESDTPFMRRLRWVILGLLFAASVINFIDRQSLSILARTIQDDLKISDLGYSSVVQLFLLAYMLS